MPLKILREFFLKKVELCFHVSLSHHNFIRGVRALQVAHLSLMEQFKVFFHACNITLKDVIKHPDSQDIVQSHSIFLL